MIRDKRIRTRSSKEKGYSRKESYLQTLTVVEKVLAFGAVNFKARDEHPHPLLGRHLRNAWKPQNGGYVVRSRHYIAVLWKQYGIAYLFEQ